MTSNTDTDKAGLKLARDDGTLTDVTDIRRRDPWTYIVTTTDGTQQQRWLVNGNGDVEREEADA